MTRRAARVDKNQAEIVDALRAIGVVVRSLAVVGDGMNDLLCAIPQATFLIEVKVPGETLTPAQKKWHRECPWRNHICFDISQALDIVSYYRRAKAAA